MEGHSCYTGPDNWNGRFLFQGGGGLNGSVLPPRGALAAGNTPALARGFAVVSTDTAHQGTGVFDGSFFSDQQASLDFDPHEIPESYAMTDQERRGRGGGGPRGR